LKSGRAVFTASVFAVVFNVSTLWSAPASSATDSLQMELVGTASGSTFAHTSLLADAASTAQFSRSDRLAERTKQVAAREPLARTLAASALTPPPSTTTLATKSTSAAFESAGDQAPSAWLMGGVILFLIGYQLRRKHRLLRPYRFYEL
jgi:hypothetical protein